MCTSGVHVCACLRCLGVADYLQGVEVGQPHTVSPSQVPAEVVVTDVNGLQVPRFVPEEVQHVQALWGINIVLWYFFVRANQYLHTRLH